MIPPMDISDEPDDSSDASSTSDVEKELSNESDDGSGAPLTSDVKEELSLALSMIKTPGSFVHFGSAITNPNPGLSVDGHVIGLPLGKKDAEISQIQMYTKSLWQRCCNIG